MVKPLAPFGNVSDALIIILCVLMNPLVFIILKSDHFGYWFQLRLVGFFTTSEYNFVKKKRNCKEAIHMKPARLWPSMAIKLALGE